jgi:nucleotide-binding universal stress UspA family protein
MKKILVPTDFSDFANDAWKAATELALKTGAELFLLHLEYVMNAVAVNGNSEDEHIRTSRNRLFRLADETERLGLKVHTIFVEDQGLDSIEEYIKPYSIDFIVMGSHGQSGIKDLLVGSTTKHVVKTLNAVNISFPTILFASEFRENLSAVMPGLDSFAGIFNSEVKFLFLNQLYHLIDKDQAGELMKKYESFFHFQKPVYSIAETNDDYTAIMEFLKISPSDLIAVCLEKQGLPGFFSGSSLAEKLIRFSEVPVLIFPRRLHGSEK